MLYQIHHQFKDGKTEMCTQTEMDVYNHDKMRALVNHTRKSHPLPEGAIYMVCNEKSPHFVWAVAKDN